MLLISIFQGTRYAFLAVKIFLVKFFSKFRVKASKKTNQGLLEVTNNFIKKINMHPFLQPDPNQTFGIKGGTWMKLEKRD